MELIYQDRDIVVCIKPPRVLSTDEPGGVPELVEDGVTGYLAKPWDAEDLAEKFRRMIADRKKMRQILRLHYIWPLN